MAKITQLDLDTFLHPFAIHHTARVSRDACLLPLAVRYLYYFHIGCIPLLYADNETMQSIPVDTTIGLAAGGNLTLS